MRAPVEKNFTLLRSRSERFELKISEGFRKALVLSVYPEHHNRHRKASLRGAVQLHAECCW